MSEHQLVGISPRTDIAGANWHEVGCSCGWVRKYPSRYRCEFMHEQHQRREATIEMERSAS
jgi:hypothetical protein